MTTPEKREALLAGIDRLPEKDRAFAASLCRARYPSMKQWEWIGKLADRLAAPPAKRESVAVGDVKGIVRMFDHYSANHVKLPKIVLHTKELGLIVIHKAGEGSAYPGCIQVKQHERNSEGKQKWYGRIYPDGRFEVSPKFTAEELAPVSVRLQELSADPLKVAAEHGRLTGRCCFCNIRLTDPRSTQMGYGPQCADNYGLDWGREKFAFEATPVEVVAPPVVQAPARNVKPSTRRIRVRNPELEMQRMEAAADREGTIRDEHNKWAARARMERG